MIVLKCFYHLKVLISIQECNLMLHGRCVIIKLFSLRKNIWKIDHGQM